MPKHTQPGRRRSKAERLQATLDGQPVPMTTAQRAALPVMMAKGKALMLTAAIEGAQVDYAETRNPLHLLTGFVLAHRAGGPMPEWVLQAMVPAIERVLENHGKITLDKALGLTPKKGQRTRWTEQAQHLQDGRLKWLFDQQLNKGLPLVSDQAGADSAVAAVAAILNRDPDTHTRTPNDPPAPTVAANEDTLRQTYQRRLKPHASRYSK